jgi:hypothetical protein
LWNRSLTSGLVAQYICTIMLLLPTHAVRRGGSISIVEVVEIVEIVRTTRDSGVTRDVGDCKDCHD